jgi:hypothetical protein
VLRALPSAFYRALGIEVFAECRTRQSSTLGNDRVCRLSAQVDTRQTPLFFAEYRVTLGKVFIECPIKSTRQRSHCRYDVQFAELSLSSATLGKDFAECFPGEPDSGSVHTLQLTYVMSRGLTT